MFLYMISDKMSRKQTPSEFLKKIIGRPVVVKLNSGVDYRGTVSNLPCHVFSSHVPVYVLDLCSFKTIQSLNFMSFINE